MFEVIGMTEVPQSLTGEQFTGEYCVWRSENVSQGVSICWLKCAASTLSFVEHWKKGIILVQKYFVRLFLALSLAQVPKASCFYLLYLFVFSVFNLFKHYMKSHTLQSSVWCVESSFSVSLVVDFSHYSTDLLTPLTHHCDSLFLKFT